MAYCEAPDMHEHLQCSVCLDVFNDPVTTPCGHNFCKTCLTACWVQSQDYRCPYCKGTFIQRPDLKFNVTLKAIVQLFEKNPEGLSTAGEPLSDELQCSICLDVLDNPVTTPCGHSFCDNCLKKCWDNSENCTCPVCKETFNKRPDLKCNTGLKAIVKVFEKNSGYKREKVMTEYSPPLEREDQEETLVKPSVMASSTDILFKDLQCSVDPDLFNNPLIACACGHNFKTCLLEISQDCNCPYCKENISEMLDLREMVQFWPHSEICRCQSFEAKPGLYEKVLNIKQVIMIELSENINLNICKKHEAILELLCRGRSDNEQHKRNLELFYKDFQTSVYLFCTEGDHRTHNTLPVDSAEIKTHIHVQHIIQDTMKKRKEIKHSVEPSKGVEKKLAECLPAPPTPPTTGRKRRRESIDIPPFMAYCEAPDMHEHLQCSVCLDVFNDPVTTPCGVVEKLAECLQAPPTQPTTGRKRKRESIDIPPFMASCEAPVHEHLQFSLCLNVFNDPVTAPYGHNLCKTCLTVCWEHSQEYRCPSFLQRPDLKFNVALKAIVQLFKKNPEGLPDAESTSRALGEPHS